MTKTKVKINETNLVHWCLDYLTRKGYYAWRNNTGAQKIESKTGPRFFRFGKKGSADILGLTKEGRFLAIECKVGKNKPTWEQLEFMEQINKNGGIGFFVYTPEELMAKL